MDAPDTECESASGPLFDQAGFDRLTAHPDGQVAKLRVDIDAGDPAVRRGLRTALGKGEGGGDRLSGGVVKKLSGIRVPVLGPLRQHHALGDPADATRRDRRQASGDVGGLEIVGRGGR